MFNEIEEAIDDLKKGKVVIAVDDEHRENEGDFIGLGDNVTPEMINFMITRGKGLVCIPISEAIARRLELPYMTDKSSDPHDTAFTVSIDHGNVKSGVSAYDRALTIKSLTEKNIRKEDFIQPGHVFPLIARKGGVLERPGHTEAAIDLASLCNASRVGIVCEIIKEDGTMAQVPDLRHIADTFNLKMIAIKDLITYRKHRNMSALG